MTTGTAHPNLRLCIDLLDALDAIDHPATLHWLSLRLARRSSTVREALAHLAATNEVRVVQQGTRTLYTTTTD